VSNKKKINPELPKFYDVDGKLVKVDVDTTKGIVYGRTSDGKPFPPIIAFEDGKVITEEEFNRLKKEAKK